MAADGGTPIQARPSLDVEGERDATLTASLTMLDIIDSADGLARCELWFGNWGSPEGPGFQHFDRRQVELGKAFGVRLGDDSLFEGRVSAIRARFPEGATPQIGVCLEDRLQDLRMARRTRCFADATLDDVIERIARDHGLRADANLNGPRHSVLAQMNQSDLAFLRDLARTEDVQLWAEGSTLKAAKRGERGAGSLELRWAGGLRSFEVSADLAHQRTALVASGWDVSTKQRTSFQADDAVVSGELGDGESGAVVLRQAFGERVDTLAHGVPADDEIARVLAQSSMRHLARRFVVGRGVAETRSELRVGARLTLGGVGPLFDGGYTLTQIHHRFDGQGLRTEICCDRPALGRGQ